MAKKANQKFKDLFDKDDLFDIITDFNDNSCKDLKKIISDNKNIIKKEILKEAITGLHKFSNYEKIEEAKEIKHIADHIFTFDYTDLNKLKIEDISDDIKLNNYVNLILNQSVFNFSLKASNSKSKSNEDEKNSSFIVLRVKALFKEETRNIQQSQINYVYQENFISDYLNKTKKSIDNIYNDFKIKMLKILFTSKNKANKLLNLFGLNLKVKKASMPAWIVRKL
jgi:hypothetical protein